MVLSEKKKAYTTTTERKIFWGTFLASKKNFPGRWWIPKPYKNQENRIHHRNLSSVDPHFFLQRKVLHWSRAVYAFFFPDFPINLQGAAEQLQAAVRNKAAHWCLGLPALPITKKGRAKGKITKIHHIFTLQFFGDSLML